MSEDNILVALKKLNDTMQGVLRAADEIKQWKESIDSLADNIDYMTKLLETMVFLADEQHVTAKVTRQQFRDQLNNIFKMMEGTPAGEILNKVKESPQFKKEMDEVTRRVFKGGPLSSLFENQADHRARRKLEKGR